VPTSASAVADRKARLRQAVREARRRRRDGDPDGRSRAIAAEAVAAATLAWLAGRSRGDAGRLLVAAYESWPTEPPTEALVTALRAAGHTVLLPITHSLPDRTLDWYAAGLGPQQPWGVDAIVGADLVLAPGLLVDATGTRLGQGGGYYDTALAHLPASVPVLAILWDDELTTDLLPRDAHDRPVDGVLRPGFGLTWLGRESPGRLTPID